MTIHFVGQWGERGDLQNRNPKCTDLEVAGRKTTFEFGKAQTSAGMNPSEEKCENSEDCNYSRTPGESVGGMPSHFAPPVRRGESNSTHPREGGSYEQRTRARESHIHLDHVTLHPPLLQRCPSAQDHGGADIPEAASNTGTVSSLPMLEDHGDPDGWK
jgi:hypothetical protein